MADIFLSYARADRARVAKLAEALQAAGFSLWWDSAIVAGASFAADIERELDAADVVVVAWSATSVKSDWVRDEANAGRDRKRLVPVQLDATPPPLGFRQLQAIHLSDWQGSAGDPRFVALVGAIRTLAGSNMANPAAPPPPTPASPGPSRRLLIGAGAGVAALAAGGFGAWKAFGGKADDGTASVVVLPFANLSGDPGQAFFSDGIAEELRNALSQIHGLKVIGRVSSEQFRDARDVSEAATRLGVDHVLTGSVRRSATTIRIGAQLVDGRTGVESWSASYDQPVGDALAIQSKIATSVVSALSAKLGAAVGTIVVGGTNNAQAQEVYLKAWNQSLTDRSEAGYRQILAMLSTAASLDPEYADAWALIGTMKSSLRRFPASHPEQMRLANEAIAANQRAVSLAPNSAFVRVLLAQRFAEALDLRQAFQEVQSAIKLDSSDPRVLSNAAKTLRLLDPDRAVNLAAKAAVIDPLNPDYIATHGLTLQAARRFKEAAVVGQRAMALSFNERGGDGMIHTWLGLGRTDAARPNVQHVPFPAQRLAFAAIVEARGGDRAASDAAMEKLRQINDVSIHYRLASAQAQRGEDRKSVV